jgi:hypothetical protein
MSTSDNEDDITPDLEELDSDNDDENLKLSQILQKISECNCLFVCYFFNKFSFSMFSSERTWCKKIT